MSRAEQRTRPTKRPWRGAMLSGMVILLAFGLLLWGRLRFKDVTRTAVAEPDAPAGAVERPMPLLDVHELPQGVEPLDLRADTALYPGR